MTTYLLVPESNKEAKNKIENAARQTVTKGHPRKHNMDSHARA